MPNFSIGVDLGGTNLRVAVVTSEGRLLEKLSIESQVSLGPDPAIDKMCSAIQQLITKYKNNNCCGVGLGLPGIVDLENGVMRKAANLPGWENYPARDEIKRRLRSTGVPENTAVVVENDARAAALGEHWIGAGRGLRNMAMLTLGTGIGGCIILDGKIWHGRNGMAGEFGHVTVEPDGEPCGCGNRGCAERYASASAIVRMAREAVAGGEAPSLTQAASAEPEFGAKSVYELATKGDDQARNIFHTFGRYLGILLADLVNVLNLEMFVIGGGAASAWDAFAPTMMRELRERSIVFGATVPHPASHSVSSNQGYVSPQMAANDGATIITRALLGSDAGLYGAAHLAPLANQKSAKNTK
jgi:glucokinase